MYNLNLFIMIHSICRIIALLYVSSVN